MVPAGQVAVVGIVCGLGGGARLPSWTKRRRESEPIALPAHGSGCRIADLEHQEAGVVAWVAAAEHRLHQLVGHRAER